MLWPKTNTKGAVRRQKDVSIAARAAGDTKLRHDAQRTINALMDRYDKIADAAGVDTEYSRMRVSGFKHTSDKELRKAAGKGIIDAGRIVEEAKIPGGRHHGKYMDAMTWEEKSVKKSIRSYEKTSKEHWEKIADPAKYDANWNEKDTIQRNGLLRKWEKDAIRNQEIAEVMRSVAEERGIKIQ